MDYDDDDFVGFDGSGNPIYEDDGYDWGDGSGGRRYRRTANVMPDYDGPWLWVALVIIVLGTWFVSKSPSAEELVEADPLYTSGENLRDNAVRFSGGSDPMADLRVQLEEQLEEAEARYLAQCNPRQFYHEGDVITRLATARAVLRASCNRTGRTYQERFAEEVEARASEIAALCGLPLPSDVFNNRLRAAQVLDDVVTTGCSGSLEPLWVEQITVPTTTVQPVES